MPSESEIFLKDKLKGKTVVDVETSFNEVWIGFEDGSKLKLKAHGYEGTTLKCKLKYTGEESFNIG